MGLKIFIGSLIQTPVIVGDITWGSEIILMGSVTTTFED